MQPASALRIERLRLGLSAEDIARACGVSKSLVCYWETGQRKLAAADREKIRKYLLTVATAKA